MDSQLGWRDMERASCEADGEGDFKEQNHQGEIKVDGLKSRKSSPSLSFI